MYTCRFIQVKPTFKQGNLLLRLDANIDPKVLQEYAPEEDTDWLVNFFPWVIQESNRYFLQINELSTKPSSLKKTLNELLPWLENAHFFIYFENARFTFETLEIIEVAIDEGQLYFESFPIKKVIPNSIFLALDQSGVQQSFDLPFELLMAKKAIWNIAIKKFLSLNCKDMISHTLGELQKNPDDLCYGVAFNLNYELYCLDALNIHLESNLFENLTSIQKRHREILLQSLLGKVGKTTNSVSHLEFETLEKKLGIQFPLTFKRIYTEISNGGFGPGFGFLPLLHKKYSIESITLLFRDILALPNYLVPFAYLGKGIYCVLNTSCQPAFSVLNFKRTGNLTLKDEWYDAFEQQTDSFEEWMHNWLFEIFPKIYKCQ